MVNPNHDYNFQWSYHPDEDPFLDRLPPGPDIPEDILETLGTLPNQDESVRVIPLPLDNMELVMPLDPQADHLYPSEIDEVIDLNKISDTDTLNYLRHYIPDDECEVHLADHAHGAIIFKHCIQHAGLTVEVCEGSSKPELIYQITSVDRISVERADDEMPHSASKYSVTLKHAIWIQNSDPSLEWHARFLTRSIEQLPPLKILPFPEAPLPDINHYFGKTVIQLYADQHPGNEASGRGRSGGGGRDAFEGGTNGILGRGSDMDRRGKRKVVQGGVDDDGREERRRGRTRSGVYRGIRESLWPSLGPRHFNFGEYKAAERRRKQAKIRRRRRAQTLTHDRVGSSSRD